MAQITPEEFDMTVVGILMMLAVLENSTDAEQKAMAAQMVVKGLALLKVGVFGVEA